MAVASGTQHANRRTYSSVPIRPTCGLQFWGTCSAQAVRICTMITHSVQPQPHRKVPRLTHAGTPHTLAAALIAIIGIYGVTLFFGCYFTINVEDQLNAPRDAHNVGRKHTHRLTTTVQII